MLLSPQAFDTAASGALLFACNGRGQELFGAPDRDITTLQHAMKAAAPCAGMFCAGELGPVGERNFLHGHTASIAIVRPKLAVRTVAEPALAAPFVPPPARAAAHTFV